jgi:hypothetical protein
MDLYLHIGTEKTGTTSVQKFLRKNRELLARNGILYPEAPGPQNHTGLAAAAQDVEKVGPLRKSLGLTSEEAVRKHRAEMMAAFKAELGARPWKTVVMSGEHCSSQLGEDAEVRWLKDWLAPLFDTIRIVIYLRRQDDFLLSLYSTAVKSGATHSIRVPADKALKARYDHWGLLERWAHVFGREAMICRRFERARLKNGDIVDDFLDAAGIDPGLDFERPEDVNESMDAETLEFLRLFNQHVPRFEKGKVNPSRDNVVSLLSKASGSGPLLTLGADELARFMGQFHDGNARVAAEYFGGARSDSDDPLFAPRADTRARTRQAVLTVERAVELCARLWQEKQAQVDRIAERAKRRRDAARGERKRRRGAEEDLDR